VSGNARCGAHRTDSGARPSGCHRVEQHLVPGAVVGSGRDTEHRRGAAVFAPSLLARCAVPRARPEPQRCNAPSASPAARDGSPPRSSWRGGYAGRRATSRRTCLAFTTSDSSYACRLPASRRCARRAWASSACRSPLQRMFRALVSMSRNDSVRFGRYQRRTGTTALACVSSARAEQSTSRSTRGARRYTAARGRGTRRKSG